MRHRSVAGGDVNFLPVFLIAGAFIGTVLTICLVACYMCKQDTTLVYSTIGGGTDGAE